MPSSKPLYTDAQFVLNADVLAPGSSGSSEELQRLRQSVNAFYRKDEVEVIEHLLLEVSADNRTEDESSSTKVSTTKVSSTKDSTQVNSTGIKKQARQWVMGIRDTPSSKNGVDTLLNEFSLSTDEGVSLMCLAEALLRVPDSYTMDRLIRDKLAAGDWSSHLGHRDSFFVNASTWGLLLTGKLTSYVSTEDGKLDGAKTNTGRSHKERLQKTLKHTLGRLGEPVIRAALRAAMQVMGSHFVMGKTISEAITRSDRQGDTGYRYSFDMLGEGARTQADADRYWQRYSDAIECIGRQETSDPKDSSVASAGISIKLSALHPRYHFSQRERVIQELVPKLKLLVLQAKTHNIGLTIDAEEASRLDLSLDIIERIALDSELGDWQGFGLAVQAYQKRALILIDWVRALAQHAQRKMVVRLVKGAYWDSEIKWTQELGCRDYPVFTRKAATDVSYQACAQKLLRYRADLYPQFATHNAYTVATVLAMDDRLDSSCHRTGYEFQRLHGMGDSLYEQVMAAEKVPCRVYAPVGEHADLLAYLVRRLLENGANSSFVNRLLNDSISVDVLLEDPLDTLTARPNLRHPDIPLPVNLYRQNHREKGRQNSEGLDLTDRNTLDLLKQNLHAWWLDQQESIVPVLHDVVFSAAESLSAHEPESYSQENYFKTDYALNPADKDQPIGELYRDSAEAVEKKLALAQSAFSDWSALPVKQRANLFRALAETLEQHRVSLIGLCIKESGKTLEDAVSEVREAVDFCRYYADQAEELMIRSGVESRGVILCISPWNFPLAIFLGQVSAALLTGNTVVAKPAEHSRLIALKVLELMTICGFPHHILQLLMTPGGVVGEVVLPDRRIQGVMFTGSTATGRVLAQVLADRPDTGIPLIAETGGQNVMIVDSTALPEQVVDDVIVSGFRSAGQRCSALRVLFLQNEVADDIVRMLCGAMAELTVGDPAVLHTDVGPVIGEKAKTRLQLHIEYLDSLSPERQLLEDKTVQTGLSVNASAQAWAKCLYRCGLPKGENGYFFAPHLYEISDVSVLTEEVFGPVVHVIRYAAKDLDKLIDKVNGLGYGLTMGVHSRIDSVADSVVRRAKVGNIYVNRNMIGAVVGVQPFGGRGLSGTGPKAGGPQYLRRLVRFSVDDFNEGAEKDARADGELAAVCVEDKAVAPRLHACRECVRQWQRQDEAWVKELLAEALPEIRKLTELVGCGRLNPQALIGPAGELNQLRLEPRGHVAIVLEESASLKDAVVSAMAALLVGSPVTLVVDPAHQRKLEALMNYWSSAAKQRSITDKSETTLNHESPLSTVYLEPFDELQPVCLDDATQAVMVIGSEALEKSIQQWLAKRESGMIPLISCEPVEQRLMRLTVEKTVTMNLSAAGGDAALMGLS